MVYWIFIKLYKWDQLLIVIQFNTFIKLLHLTLPYRFFPHGFDHTYDASAISFLLLPNQTILVLKDSLTLTILRIYIKSYFSEIRIV